MDAKPLAWNGPYCPFILACDDAPRHRRWAIRQRRLEYWLLVLSLDGSEEIAVDGHGFKVRPGDAYLIQPGQLHDLGSPAGNTPVWAHFDVLFDPRRAEPRHFAGPYDSELGGRAALLQPSAHATWGIDLPVLLPEPAALRVRGELPALVARHRIGTPPARLEATARLQLLLAGLVDEAWRAGGIAAAPADEDRIASAEAVARHRLDTGFGLEAFAAAAGLGRSRFCEVYRAVRGIAPGEFLRRARQARAEGLLRGTGLPLAQVALLSGYADATVFVRAFRRATGLTPGAWRARG